MNSFNNTHPELQKGEVFLTNAREWEWDSIPFQSKRRGETAYQTDGTLVSSDEEAFPVFVAQDEYAEKHAAQK